MRTSMRSAGASAAVFGREAQLQYNSSSSADRWAYNEFSCGRPLSQMIQAGRDYAYDSGGA